MEREALEWIAEQQEPKLVERNGRLFTNGGLVVSRPSTTEVRLNSLSAFVDLVDNIPQTGKLFVDVQSPTEVMCFSDIREGYNDRDYYAVVSPLLPQQYPFGRYQSQTEFIVALRSLFMPTDDQKLVLKFAAGIKNSDEANLRDNGVSQEVELRTSIANTENVEVPQKVVLQPFRTFLEVGQPKSEFVFRVGGGNNPTFALFEADGGAWKLAAMSSIREYLRDAFANTENVIVLG